MHIYKITNEVNNKLYIGLTRKKNPSHRWREHLYALRKGESPCTYLQNAFNKYGESNFKFEVIQSIIDDSGFGINNLERYWIGHYQSNDSRYGYNMTEGGEGITGYKLNSIQRKKISDARKGIKFSEQTRLKMSLAKKGKPGPWLGKKRSLEDRRKFSESHKGQVSTRRKPVYATNLSSNEFLHFESIQAASKKLSISEASIRNVCKGQYWRAKGWTFQYAESNKNKGEISHE